MDLESSVQLLERYKGGDPDALERLLNRYLRPLRRWARGRLPQWARDGSDTQDLVQDAILHSLQHLTTFEATRPGALHAYLRSAIKHRICDAMRRAQRRPSRAEFGEAIAAPEPTPLEAAMGAELVDRYEAALAALREADREAVIAFVEWGFTYEEIAAAFGKPSVDAARMFVRRAVVKLAELMRPGATGERHG